MAKFSIISKDNARIIRYEGKPKYIGTYLKPSYLEFSEIASPTPIDWEVGDYIDYPRTGMRYRLYSIPQASKNARKGSHGRAFTYSNVQLHAATKELEIAFFKDLVPADNNIHFSTSPDVATFEDVYGIARRIQACMDDLYPNRWTIKVADFSSSDDAEVLERIRAAKDFALSGGTCLDALTKIYELWQEVGWIHTYDSASGKEVITIGYANKRINANTTEEFIYGKGKGLTAIKKTQANKDEFATRLYVYGSERNLPARYYNGQNILNAESVDIRNLMLPIDKWGKTGGMPDARKAYLENASAVAKYGVIPKVHYFDSDDAGADIYPSIEGMTIGNIRKAQGDLGIVTNVPTYEFYPSSSERVDEIKRILELPSDNGELNPAGKTYAISKEIEIADSSTTKQVGVAAGTFTLISNMLIYQEVVKANFHWGEVTVIPSLHYSITDAGFTSVTAQVRLADGVESDAELLRAEKTISITAEKDETTGVWVFDLKDITANYDGVVYDGGFPVNLYMTISATKVETSEAKDVAISTTGGSISLKIKEIFAKTFDVSLKQIGFNIEDQAQLGNGKRISMKSGACQGRDFVIEWCRYNEVYDEWFLRLRRQQDDSLGMLFPNTDYKISAGDRFVLLDIAMPEIYVRTSMERLLSEGQKLLSRVSKIQNNYEPAIDAKVMIESGRTIREGMFMQISDEDVVDGNTEYILIDTINIFEDEAAIPTYKVTLKEKKKVSYKGTPSATTVSNTKSVGSDSVVTEKVDLSGYVTKEDIKALGDIKDYFYKTEDGQIGTKYDFFSEGEISANGMNAGSGGGGSIGGGLITSVLGKSAFGSVASEDNSTTFNAFAIDSLYKRLVALEGKNVDLSGYYTSAQTDSAIATALVPYVKTSDADAKYASLSSFNALKSSFDALNSALNDDVSGKINTWNEIVDFLNEYSGSQDLATILSGMNSDIASRLKTSDFETWKANSFNPLVDRVTTAERNITKNTNAINSINSHMQGVDDTITAIQKQTDGINQRVKTLETWRTATDKTITSLSSQVSTNTTNINTNRQNIERIFSWFSEDADGNVFTTRNFYSTLEVSGNGLTNGTGGGGSYPRLDSWANYDPAAGAVLSAILGNDLRMRIESHGSRISALEGASTSVSVSNLSSVGTRIATITIDGVAHDIKGDFLGTFGGAISTNSGSAPLMLSNTSAPYVAIGFKGNNGIAAYLAYNAETDKWEVSKPKWAGTYAMIHSGNVGNYAFVPYGSTGADLNTIRTNGSYYVAANATNAPAPYGQLICSKNVDTFAQIYIHYASDAMRFRGGNDAAGYYAWRTVLDDKNYSQYALPLSGGTVKSADTAPLTIDTSDATMNSLLVRLGGTPKARLVYHTTYGAYFANDTVGYRLGIDNSGVPFYFDGSNKTLIHSGNVGKYKAGDSDKLGGYGRGRIRSYVFGGDYREIADGTDLNSICGTENNGLWNAKNNTTYTNAPYQNFGLMSIRLNSSYFGQLVFPYGNNNTNFCYRSEYYTPSGKKWSSWRDLAFTDSNVASATNSTYCANWGTESEHITYDLGTANNTDTWVPVMNQGKMQHRVIPVAYNSAPSTLSVLSATKLTTARTIWGQSFDGTGNVSGNINLNLAKLIWRGEESYSISCPTTATAAKLLYKAFNGHQFEYSGGIAMLINPSGNVLIGTTTDSGYKLDVAGDIASSGALRIGLNSAYGAYLKTNEEGGWTGIYSANKGIWQASNMYLMPDGEVRFVHAARIIGKNTNGDTGFFVDGTQYSIWFGVGSGNVNRGIYDINNNGWWIYRGSDTLTRISGGIETSTGSFTGAVTMSSTLSVGGESTFGDHVTLTSGKRLKLAASNGIYLNNYGIHYQGASANAVNSIFSFSDSGYTTTIHSFFVNPASGVDVQLGNSEYPFYSLATKQIKAHTFYKVSEATNASGQAHQSKAGWYRIFTSRPTNAGSTPIRLFIARNYVSPHNESYVFDITVSYNGKINITQVSGINKADSDSLIDQIRVDWTNNDIFYIDFHKKVENNYSNQYMVWGIGDGEFQTPTRVSDTPVGTAYKFNTRRGFKQQGEAFFTTANPYSGNISAPTVVTIDAVDEYATALNVFGKIKLKNLVEFYYHSGNKAVRLSHSFYSDGEISANGLSTSSDIRYKNRMNDVSLSLDTIANAPIFRYTWKHIEDGKVHLGTSAQYWLDTEAKELVSINNEDFHRLDYATLGVMMGVTLAKKAKSHEERIKELEMKVESLEAENRRLRYGN